MTHLCMTVTVTGYFENAVKEFDAEREEREAEYQSERQSHNAQMADILYLKRTMIEEYEAERAERDKTFRQEQQQRKIRVPSPEVADVTPVVPVARSTTASFLRETDNSIISERSSLCEHLFSSYQANY